MQVRLTRLDLWRMGNKLSDSYNTIHLTTAGGMQITIPVSLELFEKIEEVLLTTLKIELQSNITKAISGNDRDKTIYTLEV